MIENVLLGAALLALAGWVIAPLLIRRVPAPVDSDTAASELLENKHAVYRSILDLEHDHRLGKVRDEDYLVLRREHENEAAQILGELDRGASPDDLDRKLEEEIAEARRRLQTR